MVEHSAIATTILSLIRLRFLIEHSRRHPVLRVIVIVLLALLLGFLVLHSAEDSATTTAEAVCVFVALVGAALAAPRVGARDERPACVALPRAPPLQVRRPSNVLSAPLMTPLRR